MNIRQKLIQEYFRIKIRVIRLFSARAAAKEAFRIFCTPLPLPPPKPKETFLAADKVNFLWQGLHINGYAVNSSGNKKLLLLHGFNSNCNNFEKYVSPATEKGYAVYAFNAPAHGTSEGKTINGIDYANFIISLQKKFGPFDAFISHSFGGLAVCLALEQIPHHIFTKLVLIAPATETTSAVDFAFKQLHINSPAVRREFEKLILQISHHHISWFSVKRAITNISAQVLWLHDYDDLITPIKDAMAVKADNHSNIRFIFTRNLGHRNIYRNPDQIEKVIEFL